MDNELMSANSLCLGLEDPIGAVSYRRGAVLLDRSPLMPLKPSASRSFAGATELAGSPN